MPRKPLSPCNRHGCPELTDHPRGLCPVHRSEAEKARGSSSDRGYGSAWQRRRKRFLQANPVCQEDGCLKLATEAHHVPPRRELVAQGVKDPDAYRFLVALCKSHHSQRTRRGE